MAKRGSDQKPEAPVPPFNNPFGSLQRLRDELPSTPVQASQEAKPRPGPARAVVRLERKGRGGKEVTVVSHLELRGDELEVWLKALKNGLGCGGVVEGDELVLQGDQRERITPLLTGRGVRKVTVG